MLAIYEIDHAIILKIKLQALHWLETVSKNILFIGKNELFALFLLCHEICCIGWKEYLKIFLSSVKISSLRCFFCAVKFIMSSVVKFGYKRGIG